MFKHAALTRILVYLTRKDAPFEASDEFERLEKGLIGAHAKWQSGVYALWYPLKDPAAAEKFCTRLVVSGMKRLLWLELRLEPDRREGQRRGLIDCSFARPQELQPQELQIDGGHRQNSLLKPRTWPNLPTFGWPWACDDDVATVRWRTE